MKPKVIYVTPRKDSGVTIEKPIRLKRWIGSRRFRIAFEKMVELAKNQEFDFN